MEPIDRATIGFNVYWEIGIGLIRTDTNTWRTNKLTRKFPLQTKAGETITPCLYSQALFKIPIKCAHTVHHVLYIFAIGHKSRGAQVHWNAAIGSSNDRRKALYYSVSPARRFLTLTHLSLLTTFAVIKCNVQCLYLEDNRENGTLIIINDRSHVAIKFRVRLGSSSNILNMFSMRVEDADGFHHVKDFLNYLCSTAFELDCLLT